MPHAAGQGFMYQLAMQSVSIRSLQYDIAGHVDVVRLLLQAGADKSIKNNDGKTALNLAGRIFSSFCCKKNIVKLLS